MNSVLQPFLLSFRDKSGSILRVKPDFNPSILPKQAGAYVLFSNKTKFIYPNGRSQVYYIGQSKNLSIRLKRHLKGVFEIANFNRNYRKTAFFWPRYQYGGKFGLNICWFTIRGIQNPKNLELELMDHFYNRYHSLPVANGAFSFGVK